MLEHPVEVDPSALSGVLPDLAEKHAKALASRPLHTTEIESGGRH